MQRDYSAFLAWGLPVGRVAGIRVRIHWTLLLAWLIEIRSLPDGADVTHWLFGVALSFLCIFLHELGHCFAARRVGGSADEVLLWPLGGLAMCHAPQRWQAQFIVAAGGPLVTLGLAAAAFGVSLFVPSFSLSSQNDYVYVAYGVLVWWQATILVLNLIPLYPLDGGRMLHAGLWGYLGRFGRRYDAFGRATVAIVWTSRVTAALGILASFILRSLDLFILMVWAWANTEVFKRYAHHEAAPDSVFGHDFSQGYTSLERGWARHERTQRRRPRRRFAWLAAIPRLWKRRRRRSADLGVEAADRAAEEKKQVDELLAKISREGMGALSRKERKFLEEVSRRWAR